MRLDARRRPSATPSRRADPPGGSTAAAAAVLRGEPTGSSRRCGRRRRAGSRGRWRRSRCRPVPGLLRSTRRCAAWRRPGAAGRAPSPSAAPFRTRRGRRRPTMPFSIARGERGFVDQLAARGVDEPQARLAACEALVVEQVVRVRPSTAGGASGSRRPRTDRRATAARRRSAAARSAEMNGSWATTRMPNARARCATSWPMRPKPGDAERLAAQLGAEETLLLPAAVLHRAIGRRDDAGQREHQRPGVLGDADAVGARRVDDEDAARAGGVDVDVVDAGSGARDDPQPRRGRHQARRHFGGAAHQQRVRVGQIGGEGVRLAPGAGIDDPARFGAQQLQRRSGESRRRRRFS